MRCSSSAGCCCDVGLGHQEPDVTIGTVARSCNSGKALADRTIRRTINDMHRGLRYTLLPALILALSVAVSTQQARLLVEIRNDVGVPLPGARFELLDEDDGKLVASCRTDSSGRCVLAVAPLHDYVIRASFSGYDGSRRISLTPAAGDNAVTVTLYPAMREPIREPEDSVSVADGLITGEVRSLADEPLAEITVYASSGHMVASRSGKDGSFQIRVPPGTYSISSGPALSTTTGQVIDAASYGAPVKVVSGEISGPIILYPGSSKVPSVNLTVISSTGELVPGAVIAD